MEHQSAIGTGWTGAFGGATVSHAPPSAPEQCDVLVVRGRGRALRLGRAGSPYATTAAPPESRPSSLALDAWHIRNADGRDGPRALRGRDLSAPSYDRVGTARFRLGGRSSHTGYSGMERLRARSYSAGQSQVCGAPARKSEGWRVPLGSSCGLFHGQRGVR